MKRKRITGLLIAVLILSLVCITPINAAETTATLKWDKVPDTETCVIKGYNVYWGKVEGTYPGHMDVGNVDEVPNLKSICGLRGETQYFFVVSAYSSDNEGPVSNVADYVTKAGYTTPPDVIPIEATVPTTVIIRIEVKEVE